MTDDGWIFTNEKLSEDEARHSRIAPDLSFYKRALAINPQGNNHTDGGSGRRPGIINSPERTTLRPFMENEIRFKARPSGKDPGECSLSGEHSGEVGNSYYRDRAGRAHLQILCETHRGLHWQLVRELPPGTLGEWSRSKKGRRT